MSLPSGTRLGPYEIMAAIGAGGMGEVYRARDAKLNRDVAIKVLLPSVANDPDRLARFSREAQVLASLNHPNIAQIFGIEESAGVTALVMELVEGEDLSQRIGRGPIPLDEALPIARQIAEALEAAHDQGIIHRDLKPANIKVRADGTVKVLDFGLAKAIDPVGTSSASAAMSPTLSLHATQAGIILGTAAYMSPEQAKGRPVDKRSDVWAFGAVLYEMLAGARPFEGEDITDVLGAVVRLEPDWSRLPPATPPAVRALVQGCLVKDRRHRVGDIAVALFALTTSASASSISTPLSSTITIQTPAAGSRRVAPLVVAAALGALVVAALAALPFGLALVGVQPAPTEAPTMRFTIAPPEGIAITGRPIISPDGRRVVFPGSDGSLWLRQLDALLAQRVSGTERSVQHFWSPDSRSVAFFADNKLKKIDIAGGPALTLCDVEGARGGSWSPHGVIVFAGLGALRQVPDAGGVPAPATILDPSTQDVLHSWPHFLPDGQHFLYVSTRADGSRGLVAGSLDAKIGAALGVPVDVSGAVYATPGVLLFTRGTTLMRQPFDAERLAVTGDPAPVAENIGLGNTNARFSASSTGTLVYLTGGALEKRRLVWVDRRGGVTPLALAAGVYGEPGLSPDGRQIALAVTDTSGSHIWVYDLERGTLGKRTFEGNNQFPIWTRDGRYLTFSTADNIGTLMQIRADGSGRPEPLVTSEQRPGTKIPSSWSADGARLAFQSGNDVVVREADGTLHPVVATPAVEQEGRFAPGGPWLAYKSNETGRNEVYVQSYPAGHGKWQISTDGGAQPMWAPGGSELFYKSGNRMMVVAVQAGATFTAGTPRALFEMPMPERIPGDPSRFIVSPDAKRFLVLTTAPGDSAQTTPLLNVVLNWPGTVAATPATQTRR